MSPPPGNERAPAAATAEGAGWRHRESSRAHDSTPPSPAETLGKPTPEEIQRRRAGLRAQAWNYFCEGSCPRTILLFYRALRVRQAREAGL